ncbi:MAG: YggS family pyridoxal phosphate-dependent enzyme [Eubacteriales bacterium]|nr:YggS family pyridoxal phosphate-dependent enzyme [Eubacteriales bacterium]
MKIAANVLRIREEIESAALSAGRAPEAVRLIAVSKTKPVSDMLEAYSAGQKEFGENYVQEVLEKAPELPDDARIHFIGHLQTNKVGKIIDKAYMIHSVDSLRLAQEIEKQAAKRAIERVQILLEVNIAEEESKFGFRAAEVTAAVREIAECCPHICIRGLMTSAPITEEPEENAPYFAAMRKLLEAVNEMIAADADGIFRETGTKPLTELSMGMSGDYIPAVREGATMVRIGTAVFGARDYHR